jgi:hypothetical protein
MMIPRPANRAGLIEALEREIAELRQEIRADLVRAIARAAAGSVFSARELWAHRAIDRDLAGALAEAGITSAHALGKFLEHADPPAPGVTIGHVSRNNGGVVWEVLIAGDAGAAADRSDAI